MGPGQLSWGQTHLLPCPTRPWALPPPSRPPGHGREAFSSRDPVLKTVKGEGVANVTAQRGPRGRDGILGKQG